MLHIKLNKAIVLDDLASVVSLLDQQNAEQLKVLQDKISATRNAINIIGGHYCVSPELKDLSNTGEPEINSFKWAAQLYKVIKQKGVPTTLTLFVNDIGLLLEERVLLIDAYKIPGNYLNILNDTGISPDEIKIIFESAIRNRASKEIRKLKKARTELFEIMSSDDPRLIRCIDPAYCETSGGTKDAITVKGPKGEYLVVKEGSNPKCNTILAILFERVSKEHEGGVIINCFNTIYQNRLTLGSWVYGLICGEKGRPVAPIINLFFDEDGLIR